MPLVCLLIAIFSIQSGAGLAKGLFPIFGAMGTSSLRLCFAALILLLIFRPWKYSFQKGDLKKLTLYGVSLGIMNLTFYLALARIPLGIAVSLEFLGPLAVSLLGKRSKLDYLWSLLAALGIYFIFPSQATGPLDLMGVFWALCAALCWALYIIFGMKVGKDIPSGVASSMGMSTAALVVLPFGLWSTGGNLIQADYLFLAIAVAILSSALPYSLEMIAMKKIPQKTFGILMSLEPACASLMGFLILSERLLGTQILAILCIMAASMGSSLQNKKGA